MSNRRRSGFSKQAPFRLGSGRSPAFTLVELLVVIAIIGILAGIIFTVFGPAKRKARETACMANLHQIALATKIYLEDQQAYPPPADPVTGLGGVYALTVYNYIGDRKQLRCPDDDVTLADYNTALTAAASGATPWTQAWFDTHYSSYNITVNKSSASRPLAVLYNYFGFYGPPNEPDPNLRAVNIQRLNWADSMAEAGRVYNGQTDDLGRALWTGYANAANPGGPTASFPGLINKQAPDNTILTRCIQHRSGGGVDLVATLSGRTEMLRAEYDWLHQP